MRTTVTLDDTLLAKVRELSGIQETSALLREVMTLYVQRESSRRLALMGGSMPDLVVPPRRRSAIG